MDRGCRKKGRTTEKAGKNSGKEERKEAGRK
jgi:hypothetical protein